MTQRMAILKRPSDVAYHGGAFGGRMISTWPSASRTNTRASADLASSRSAAMSNCSASFAGTGSPNRARFSASAMVRSSCFVVRSITSAIAQVWHEVQGSASAAETLGDSPQKPTERCGVGFGVNSFFLSFWLPRGKTSAAGHATWFNPLGKSRPACDSHGAAWSNSASDPTNLRHLGSIEFPGPCERTKPLRGFCLFRAHSRVRPGPWPRRCRPEQARAWPRVGTTWVGGGPSGKVRSRNPMWREANT